MVELQSPGVYTIETSFRARSIQGVGTSTTGFVGLARSGPVGGPPQLITSFAEFERIYGGLSDLDVTGIGSAAKTNYAAHAVRAFFNEMGARVYFSRAFTPAAEGDDGKASVDLAAGDDGDFSISARFPGAAGNGTLDVSEALSPATSDVIANAALHSLARSRGAAAASATLKAGATPALIDAGSEISIAIDGGAAATATLAATPAVISWDLPGTEVSLPAGQSLTITVDGLKQVIALTGDGQPRTADAIVTEIRTSLQRASISRAGTTVTITSAVAGAGITMSCEAQDDLGLTVQSVTGTGVARTDRITASDINAAFADAGIAGARAVGNSDGTLSLVSDTAGATSEIDISGTDAGVRAALGFQEDSASGSNEVAQTYFVRTSTAAIGWTPYTLNAVTNRWEAGGAPTDPTAALASGGYLVGVNMLYRNADGVDVTYEGLSLVAAHPRYFGNRMKVLSAIDIANGAREPVSDPLMAEVPGGLGPVDLHAALFTGATQNGDGAMQASHALTGGNDGALPSLAVWEEALGELNRYDDIAIVAAPGSSAYALVGQSMRKSLGIHASHSGFRIAVIDPPLGETLDSLRNTRGEIDNSFAAFYAPWIRIANPLARPGNDQIARDLLVPPSGHICGIYARNDQLRGVHKTPANEVIRSAIGFETDYNQAQQGVLNPLGINCLRTLKGRGNRVYGGRLATSDREVLYVSDRRYLNYIKRSLYESMQWAVFEPNGPDLWTNVREAVASFLYNEWFNGALFGATPNEAFFVICDRSVMTQADLDNGRMVCQVGLALLKPAEFVIFQIGQKTADMGV